MMWPSRRLRAEDAGAGAGALTPMSGSRDQPGAHGPLSWDKGLTGTRVVRVHTDRRGGTRARVGALPGQAQASDEASDTDTGKGTEDGDSGGLQVCTDKPLRSCARCRST